MLDIGPDEVQTLILQVVKTQQPAMEPYILQDPATCYAYAAAILHSRWQAGEAVIIRYPKWIFYYARDVIKGRWPEAEATVLADPVYGPQYQQAFLS
jgi:hypothetical protein